jgi:hypothetical protein
LENSFSNTFIYSGTTDIIYDETAPEVDQVEKSSNDIIIKFSEYIDPTTTTSSIELKKGDGLVTGTVTLMDDRTVRFTPAENLATKQEYTLWVYSTLKDLSGKSINQFFHSFMVLPDDFLLPDGTVVQFRKNSRSPYQISVEENNLILSSGRERICKVEWIPRPAYYTKETVGHHRMVKIGQIGGEDCLFFCYQNYCSHFSKKEECLFCNLVSTSRTYNSVLRKKETDDIGEVAKNCFR